MSISEFITTGQFSEDVLAMFKERVMQSGMTKCALANRFGVSPITLHKWLTGGTHRCSLSSRQKITSFLGEEIPIPAGKSFQYNRSLQPFPDSILLCMERISKAYDLCNTSEDNSRDFIGIMDHAALEALKRLAYGESNGSNMTPVD